MSTSAPADGQESPLDPDEPQTPLWFTFLGVALFLLGGIFVLATASDEDETAESAPEAVEAPSEAPSGDSEPNADPHAGHDHD